MKDEKTISYLNNKMWYRFLKVAFALFFLFVVAFPIGFTIDEYLPEKVIDKDKTEIICKYGNKKTLSPKMLDLYMYDGWKASSYDNEKILRLCNAENEKIEVKNFSTDEMVQANLKDFIGAGFEVKPIYKMEGSYLKIILYSLLSLVITLIVFEIFRRIFYYIVLGKAFPKKKDECNNLS